MKNKRTLDAPYFKSFSNAYRRTIFEQCKEPKNFTQLKKILNLSSGALTHHLKVLEEEGLITKKPIKLNDRFVVGKEIQIRSNLDKLNEVFENEKVLAHKYFEDHFPDSSKARVLKYLEDGKPMEREKFNNLLMEKGEHMDVDIFLLTRLILSGFISESLSITQKGKEFLAAEEGAKE